MWVIFLVKHEIENNIMEEHYTRLGLRGTPTSLKELKTAFRKRALACHPDKVSSERKAEAEEEFKLLVKSAAVVE